MARQMSPENKIGFADSWRRNVIAFVRDRDTGEILLSILGNGRVFHHRRGAWIGYCRNGKVYDLSRRYLCPLNELQQRYSDSQVA
jgi:hypothetical protein